MLFLFPLLVLMAVGAAAVRVQGLPERFDPNLNNNAGAVPGTANGVPIRTAQSGGTTNTLYGPLGSATELWVSRYNGPANSSDDAGGVAVSPDGSRVFVTGTSGGSGTADDWATVAYDAATGTQLWVTRFNGPGNRYDAPQAPPVVSPDGTRVYVTGTRSFGSGTTLTMGTVAYDAADGSELWVASYQGPAQMNDSPSALALSSDGSRLFVTGWSQYPSPIFRKYATIAYDTNDGSQLWVTEYAGPVNGTSDEAYAVAVSPDGLRVFVTGGSIGASTHVDFATVAYDAADGSELWVARYTGPGKQQDTARAIGLSADGSRVFVTGESASSSGSFDYATVAYGANDGSQLWVSRYNGPANSSDSAEGLAVAGNRVFVTGGSSGISGVQDFATVAYDTTDGHQLWVARYQGQDDQSWSHSATRAIGTSPDGTHVFVTGPSPGIGTNLDYVTVAYRTSDGDELWVARYDGAQADDTATGLAVHGSRVYVTGSRGAGADAFGNNDFATVAYQDQGPLPTPTPTATPPPPTPTSTPTPTATSSPTPTPTPTPIPTLTPTPTPSPTPAAQAVNLSTRMRVQTGDNVGIGGFIITGSAPKNVLLRAIGPSITGVPNILADPVLELHGPGGFFTITNNNWRDDPVQAALIPATGLAPTNDLESAIDANLSPGAYTAVVRGNNDTSGVALIEVYDLSQAVPAKLANISTRAFVSTGDDIVIAGFIFGSNSGNDRIVLRGIGPSLTALGVPDALANPMLELRDSNGALLIANNDWREDPAQAAEITAAGLAPTNPLESGIAATLPPGLYTALLTGLNNGVGNGVVEVYDRGAP